MKDDRFKLFMKEEFGIVLTDETLRGAMVEIPVYKMYDMALKIQNLRYSVITYLMLLFIIILAFVFYLVVVS